MRIKLSDAVADEFRRQKYLLETELTDEEFLAYILEARRRVLDHLAIQNVMNLEEEEE